MCTRLPIITRWPTETIFNIFLYYTLTGLIGGIWRRQVCITNRMQKKNKFSLSLAFSCDLWRSIQPEGAPKFNHFNFKEQTSIISVTIACIIQSLMMGWKLFEFFKWFKLKINANYEQFVDNFCDKIQSPEKINSNFLSATPSSSAHYRQRGQQEERLSW